MASIVTASFRVENAKNLRLSLSRTTPTPEYLYLFEGKSSPWTTEASPDTPIDAVSQEIVTRNNIIGMKRISFSDTAHVVPRINWTSGVTYVAYSDADDALGTKAFYVLTDAYNVYKCIVSPGTASTVKPTGTATTNVVTGDGYTWKYMYTVSTTWATNFLTPDYMPVPTIDEADSLQLAVSNAASYVSGGPIKGHGYSAVHELYAYYLMVNKTFVYGEGGVIPTNVAFRQVGLLHNPKAAVGGTALTGDVYAASSVDLLSGRILTVDNRSPVYRSASSSEQLQLVFQL